MKCVYLQHAGSCGNPADSLPASISVDGLAKGMLRPEVQPLMVTNGHWVFMDLGLPGS